MSGPVWIRLASLLGGAAVVIGAFGAHGFSKLPAVSNLSPAELAESLEWLETGVRYHMYHSLAILGIGAVMVARPDIKLNAAAISFFVGIVIFSGMLYVMALTHARLGAIVPIGGASFIVGWVAMLFSKYPTNING
jgi:uncharacterized membrane protein YgdD (TMEM256/DUF423 family)